MAVRISKIITHDKPHLDELVAIWLMKRFGESIFPGVHSAAIEYDVSDQKRSAFSELTNGGLMIGCGGGDFDEHPYGANGVRKENECATTLVAKALGIKQDPRLQRLFRFVCENDLKGINHAFDLADLIPQLQRNCDPHTVTYLIFTILDTHLQSQKTFIEAGGEFHQKAKIITTIGNKKALTIASICSDNPKIADYARSNDGGKANLVIVKNSKGNIAIISNKYHPPNSSHIADLAKVIRLHEQAAKISKGILKKILTANWQTLEKEGKVSGAEEWHFHPQSQSILNGGERFPEHPTNLTLEQIENFSLICLSPGVFEPNRKNDCEQGRCTSTPDNPCPWYDFGLGRCKKIRFSQNQKAI